MLLQLFAACRAGDVDEARRLLAASLQLATAADEDGITALLWAASRCCAPLIELLLQAGARPLQQDEEGYTPLALAAASAKSAADAAAVRLLLEAAPAAALVPDDDGALPLHQAAWGAHPTVVRLLLQAAPEVALRPDNEGQHPINEAVRRLAWATTVEQLSRALEAVRCLLQAGGVPLLLAALTRAPHERTQPLYADLAGRLPLTAEQWAQVPAPCAGLLRALPAVLARSEAEAAALVAHLPADEQQRLQQRLTAAAGALARPTGRSGAQLPPDVRRRVLADWLAHECTA